MNLDTTQPSGKGNYVRQSYRELIDPTSINAIKVTTFVKRLALAKYSEEESTLVVINIVFFLACVSHLG